MTPRFSFEKPGPYLLLPLFRLSNRPMTESEALRQRLDATCQTLARWQVQFPGHIEGLSQFKQALEARLARLDREGLKLSIGIMGQVKAGKSSFLNALLFDGKPILPTAATPKTANLTYICHGDAPSLKVSYYTPEEWRDLEMTAQSDSQSSQAQVARGLLGMVNAAGLDAMTVISQGETVIHAASVDELMGKLNDYVGENGRYTALVKATEIALPLEELKGFEVVDTPGMNDPVLSRTERTRVYMANCDVVFFLSRCDAFLTGSDIELLATQLPSNGVRGMVLVGGMLDEAILGDGGQRKSLADTEANLTRRLTRRAESEMELLAAAREEIEAMDGTLTDTPRETRTSARLRMLKTPILGSTFAHGFATWPPERWNSAMRNMHAELQELSHEVWQGQQINEQDWLRIGNFAALQRAYRAVRDDKQRYLQEQRESLVPEARREFERQLRALSHAAQTRRQQLQSRDLKSLEGNIQACKARIGAIAQGLGRVMQTVQARCTQAQLDAHKALSDSRGRNIAARTGTDRTTKEVQEEYQVRDVYHVKDNSWRNLWGIFGDRYREVSSYRTAYRTVLKTVLVEYEYIVASDAIEKLVKQGHSSAAEIEAKFNDIVDLASLKANMKAALVEVMDTQAQDFDPAEFRAVFDKTLDKLELPMLQMDLGGIADGMSRRFTGTLRDRDVGRFQRAYAEAVDALRELLRSRFDDAVQQLQASLQGISDSLAQQLAADLQAEREQLQAAFADKERELKSLANLIKACEAALAAPSASTAR